MALTLLSSGGGEIRLASFLNRGAQVRALLPALSGSQTERAVSLRRLLAGLLRERAA